MQRLALAACLLISTLASLSTASAQSAYAPETWGGDECVWAWNGAQWLPSNVCRVVRTATVWDLYDRSNPQALGPRLDLSVPNWLMVYVPAATFAIPNRGSILHMYDGGLATMWLWGGDAQWHSAAVLAGQPLPGTTLPVGGPAGPDAFNSITIGGVAHTPLDDLIRCVLTRERCS